MNKDKIIEKHGEEGYKKYKEERAEWGLAHRETTLKRQRKRDKKGTESYEKKRFYQMTGIPHAKKLIRGKHQERWNPFKQLIAPNSVLHHEWLPGTADYAGVALVETDQHMHGFIDVIQILEGEITLFTEAEVRQVVT